MSETYGESLARQAADLVSKAYAWAEASENPFAEAAVTQRLAQGNLVLLSSARAMNKAKGL